MNCKDYKLEIEYYENENKKEIKESLFSEEAEKVVKFLKKCLTDNDFEKKGNKYVCKNGEIKDKCSYRERRIKKKLTYTQIRKFYEEVLNLKTQLEQLNLQNKQEDNFRKILPYFKMLKAKAHVAYERDVINTNFKKFIEENVDYVTKKDENASMEEKFKIFCTFFEAVVAYAKGTINE
jgi:CRISPR type III-A-associated protein Csm2